MSSTVIRLTYITVANDTTKNYVTVIKWTLQYTSSIIYFVFKLCVLNVCSVYVRNVCIFYKYEGLLHRFINKKNNFANTL